MAKLKLGDTENKNCRISESDAYWPESWKPAPRLELHVNISPKDLTCSYCKIEIGNCLFQINESQRLVGKVRLCSKNLLSSYVYLAYFYLF